MCPHRKAGYDKKKEVTAMEDPKQTLAYTRSELMRIETMAGTLSAIEKEHFHQLNRFDQRGLADLAVEEQNAARQLNAIRTICLSLSQKIGEMLQEEAGSGTSERGNHEAVH
jgi:hypothetical protein